MNGLVMSMDAEPVAGLGAGARVGRPGQRRGMADDADRRWSLMMAAAQEGDSMAYDRLLREIVPYVRRIAAQQHRTPDRVEDVVQEVLLTIHRVRHTYDPARCFRHWLAAIARRRSIDALRRASGRFRFEVGEGDAGLAYEAYADPSLGSHDEAHASADQLGKAISALPPTQREAIELLKLREMTLAEASRLTGRSIEALKVNAHRAVKALERKMRAG